VCVNAPEPMLDPEVIFWVGPNHLDANSFHALTTCKEVDLKGYVIGADAANATTTDDRSAYHPRG